MIYPGGGKKGQPKAGDYVLAAEQTRAEAAASPHRSTAGDVAGADKGEGQARTKQLPSTRTKIGAGGELIDIEIKSSSRQSPSTARNQRSLSPYRTPLPRPVPRIVRAQAATVWGDEVAADY